ncbi:hypothetical protein NC99_27160 [Sunxiuqinia dokdonensis]|uniref:Uncharacterized protein n=1 Tax=Sunxiuqinia dokdonensis TaxID=1409788 RepID=A0A0L8V7Q7_9BACT|nr:hypothetical protein NC99_27160 [Sunxiuqinia dokdonensis]
MPDYNWLSHFTIGNSWVFRLYPCSSTRKLERTYYYTLDLGRGNEKLSGFVYLDR